MPNTLIIYGDNMGLTGHFYVHFYGVDSTGQTINQFYGKYPRQQIKETILGRIADTAKMGYEIVFEGITAGEIRLSDGTRLQKARSEGKRVISRRFRLSVQQFNNALSVAERIPQPYDIRFANCSTFVQNVYAAAGSPGGKAHFSHHFNVSELESVSLAGDQLQGDFNEIEDFLLNIRNQLIGNTDNDSTGSKVLLESEAPDSNAGDFFSSISNFFGGLFGGGSSSGATQLMPRSGGGFTRASTIDPTSVEQVVGQALEKHADRIVEKIIKKNPNIFQASVGRILVNSTERLGEAIRRGRINDFEDAISNVFRGKNGEIGLAADIGNQVIGGLLQAGVGELLNKTRTSTFTRESDRSVNANNDFHRSCSQQATELIRLLEKGRRNT